MIDIKGLKVHLGEFRLKDIDLSIDEGNFSCLWAHRRGKTVLLEAIAGLVPILGGTISISGRDATRLARSKGGRHHVSGLCPVSHLTVTRNITYGLRYQKRKGTSEKTVPATRG
jgi:molybdate/tungstate transport system ATP-binding protein